MTNLSRRHWLTSAATGAAGITIFTPVLVLAERTTFIPEAFGAKGDGIENDTDAFAAMTAAINRRGGGTVELRRATYLVGRQFRGHDPLGWAFPPADIMQFHGLVAPLTIRGNGARLRCGTGLRYGLFDRATGEPFHHSLPYTDLRQLASPYRAMISVKGCSAPIELSDLELDGNLPGLRIGGQFGDGGWQIPAVGLFLADNRSTEIVRNLHSHHHAQDGLIIDGDDRRPARSRFEQVVTEYNGRQGVSIVGGRGYDFAECKFNHSGRSSIVSPPGAGVDIEAEGTKINRDFTFTDCEFSNNSGCGMAADSGDSEGAVFTRCKFIGTTSWSAWPYKPRFVFRDCVFLGAVAHPFPDRDPARATQFHQCRFLDDPRLSPNGKVYLAGYKQHAVVDMAQSDNVLFDHCLFNLTHNGVLPWSWRATYSNCTMRQVATTAGYPKGKYVGTNTISGPVDLYNSNVIGTLTVNGKRLPNGLLGGQAW